MKEQKSQHSEIVVPAEARRQADIATSEGERQAAINRAEGRRQTLAQEGQGQADARVANADATQRELEATAAGTQAQLLAEAKGKEELALSLNAYREAGLQLEIVPQFIKELPNIYSAIASSFTNVERIVMIDSGSGGDGTVSRFVNQIPAMFAGGIEPMKAVGLDLGGFLSPQRTNGGAGATPGSSSSADPNPGPDDTTLSPPDDPASDEPAQ